MPKYQLETLCEYFPIVKIQCGPKKKEPFDIQRSLMSLCTHAALPALIYP